MSDDGGRQPQSRICFACGSANEHGLHMQFRNEDGRAVCEYEPQPFQQGYPNRMHGGVVSSLLDEAMGYATYYAKLWCATARLNVRFRKPIPMDQTLRIEAWILKNRGRLIELRAELRTATGDILAEADGTFMKLDQRFSGEMTALAREIGRTDVPPEAIT